MSSEEEYFLKKMQGVIRTKDDNKVKKKFSKIIKKKTNTDKKNSDKPLSKKNTVIKKTQYRAEPIKINKNLKKGKVKIDKKIDFHGLTVVEAEHAFKETIISCYNNQRRCILFVTGKGLNTKEKNNLFEKTNTPKLFRGKIRESFMRWVRDSGLAKYILSSEKAGASYGGDGAFLVYLRKRKN